MRRVFFTLAVFALLVAAPSASAASWAQRQIEIAVQSGLMGPSVEAFRPDAALTRRDLGTIVAGLTQQTQTVVDPDRPVTMRELNRGLVRGLRLSMSAREFRAELAEDGFEPPPRIGNETVARLLGLRYNHPAQSDFRELRPADVATLAEAAYSVAKALRLSDWNRARAISLANSFELPAPTAWQRRVLTRSLTFVGYPYVWGGMSEFTQTLFGVTSRGGFDCSGFVWRVYKLAPWSGAPRLGTTIRARTAAGMAGEIPTAARIARSRLRPGDIIFFGTRGAQSAPSEISHAGIYLGGGWLVHSSGNGTTLVPLEGWYATTFAWARRPLAEVGLG